jgi:alpha,alpha-trehalase
MSKWILSYRGFDPAEEGLREALCTLGNGYFGTRGAAPETQADGVHYPGTYFAGVYNRLDTGIAGRTIENESLVNAPNWLPFTFRLEGGAWFHPSVWKLHDYRQDLDLKEGVLTRKIEAEDGHGRRVRVTQRRIVSMDEPHLAALQTTLVSEAGPVRLHLRSALDGRVENRGVKRYSALNGKHLEPVSTQDLGEGGTCLLVRTVQSRVRIAEVARLRVFRNGEPVEAERSVTREPGYVAEELVLEIRPEEPVTVEKVVAFCHSRDRAISECGIEARNVLDHAGNFGDLLERHVLIWNQLWRRCCIELEDNERASRILNLHIFHLLQTASYHTVGLDVGVPARGLHGEAYRGHIFWDELFIFPFLTYSLPELTRALLLYRYRRLREARWSAREAGYGGAMFPWQSGSDGREENQVLHLNPRSGRWIPDRSHRQRHINIAIAYNVWQYCQVTGDREFLAYYGAEMLLEIARFWTSIATYDPVTDRYEIHKVMGPDEYHDGYPGDQEGGLDNNAYTNVGAVWVICRALEALDQLPPVRRRELVEELGILETELEHWDDVTRKMKVPFHDDGIISQFEGYEKLEEFDWEAYREKYGDIQRLDRILESEDDSPNRYKASKQADVLMLFYLLSADVLQELFERMGYGAQEGTIGRNIEYYLKRTSHGSTLSRMVHAWVLARSDRERSWKLFTEALESDYSDIQGGTTAEGIHLGAMAGTVDLIQRCYGGIEPRHDILWMHPVLPIEIKRLQFQVRYRGHCLDVDLNHERLRLHAAPCAAASVRVGVRGEVVELGSGETRDFRL